MKIAVLGYGTIGSGVVEAIETNKESIAKRAGKEIEVKYVLDLREFPGNPIEDILVHEFAPIAQDEEIECVVEAMGGVEPAYSYVKESLLRGVRYLPVDLYKSDAKYFLPEDGKIRMPFNSIGGLGDTAAQKSVQIREAGEIFSIEELRTRGGLSKPVIELLRSCGALDGLSETNQLSFF